MFLIAGIQPKTKRLSENPQQCPNCGLQRAYATRIDHYLSLFFIPLVKVKRGESVLLCEGCSGQENVSGESQPPKGPSASNIVCMACKRSFDSSFTYCPYCGQRQK